METTIKEEEGVIGRRKMTRMLLRLAVPAIVSNITVPLLGLSDTFITGHLGAEVYVAAIAVGTMMVNALYWLCGFLRMGTTGLTAEAYGRGDEELRRDILAVAVMIAIAVGAVLIMCSPLLKYILIRLLDPPESVGTLGVRYFVISVWGAPAILATMSMVGWMVGSQNTLYPMIVSIGVNVVNIIVSFILVFVCRIGFVGVAYGTLIANWIGVIAAVYLVHRMLPAGLRRIPLRGLFRRVNARRFFMVNGNLFIRSACLMSVSFALTAFAGRIGENALAVNAVLMQFFFFFSYFMDGFAFGGEALCGRFSGAREKVNLVLSIKVLGIVSGGVALFFTLIYVLFTPFIASLLTDVRTVIQGIRRIEWVAWLLPAFSVGAFMFDGIYVGLTSTGKMMLATLSGALVFFSFYYGFEWMSAHGSVPMSREGSLWICYLLCLLVRGLVLGFALPGEIRKN